MQAVQEHKPLGMFVEKVESFPKAVAETKVTERREFSRRVAMDPEEVRLARQLALRLFLGGVAVSGFMVAGITMLTA